jgi:2-C-methyl-D-erythritol 2,4-cyclodiphosphate synthase
LKTGGLEGDNTMRIGFGYDIHRLSKGRELVLGGVIIPWPRGETGYSDGDVLIHAIIDALCGAAGEGDIGTHFPPGDRQYENISSRHLLRKIKVILDKKAIRITNIDCTVILEKPKIAVYVGQMKQNLAEDLSLRKDSISIKGKTKEGLGDAGKGKVIEAYAVVLVE